MGYFFSVQRFCCSRILFQTRGALDEIADWKNSCFLFGWWKLFFRETPWILKCDQKNMTSITHGPLLLLYLFGDLSVHHEDGVMVCWLLLLHSFIGAKSWLGFCAGSNPARIVSVICYGEKLWQWPNWK